MPNLPDTISYDDVGGTKSDYTAPVNAATDRSASDINIAFVNAAMLTRTGNRGWIRFTTDGSGVPSLIGPTSWQAVWKANTSAQPVAAKSTTGVMTFTFPTTVVDEMGESHTLNIQLAQGQSETNGCFVACSCSVNVITVRTFTAAGTTPADIASATFNLIFI